MRVAGFEVWLPGLGCLYVPGLLKKEMPELQSWIIAGIGLSENVPGLSEERICRGWVQIQACFNLPAVYDLHAIPQAVSPYPNLWRVCVVWLTMYAHSTAGSGECRASVCISEG